MKILLHGLNFTPELTGIGKYTGEMAEWLAAAGHEVRVVTAPPYYPAWKVSAGHRNSWHTETWKGAAVWRTPLYVPAKPGGLKRLLHLASFAASSLPVMLRQALWRPDVVWVVEPAFMCAPGAWLTARLSGAKAWLHVQDFEVDAAFDMNLIRGERLKRWAGTAERWLKQRFDVVSTISGRMRERALSKELQPGRVLSFPNWVDIGAISPLTAASSYRQELGLAPDAVVALYSGNMGGKQGLEILAELAQRLAGYLQLQFVFCGNGAGRADLEQQCAGMGNVRFLDLQPLERLSELLGLADIHLLPQRADAADLVMPSKLTGMLASGRPVVATASPHTELGRVVSQGAGCGLIVPPEDAAAMANAVMALADDPVLRAQMGASGRAYAERELDRDEVLGRFERQLRDLVGGALA